MCRLTVWSVGFINKGTLRATSKTNKRKNNTQQQHKNRKCHNITQWRNGLVFGSILLPSVALGAVKAKSRNISFFCTLELRVPCLVFFCLFFSCKNTQLLICARLANTNFCFLSVTSELWNWVLLASETELNHSDHWCSVCVCSGLGSTSYWLSQSVMENLLTARFEKSIHFDLCLTQQTS